MKITFEKNELISGLSIISKAISTKTTSTILECVLIETTDSGVSLTANDTSLGIKTVIKGDVAVGGKLALKAGMLTDIVRRVDSDSVTIENDDSSIATVTGGKSLFNIQCHDAEEFSYLPEIEKDRHMSLSQYSLKQAITQTSKFIGANESNIMMTGVCIELKEDVVTFTALDTHRVAIRNIYLKGSFGMAKVIVPGNTMKEIGSILASDNEKEVAVYFTKNHIQFEFDKTVVLSRLIDGEFFNLSSMIKDDYDTKFTTSRVKLSGAMDRASILTKESDPTPIIFNVMDGLLKIKLRSSSGNLNDEIDIKKEGADLKIAFNPRFVLDALGSIEDEQVDIYMTNHRAPMFVRDEKKNYNYMILPVNFVDREED